MGVGFVGSGCVCSVGVILVVGGRSLGSGGGASDFVTKGFCAAAIGGSTLELSVGTGVAVKVGAGIVGGGDCASVFSVGSRGVYAFGDIGTVVARAGIGIVGFGSSGTCFTMVSFAPSDRATLGGAPLETRAKDSTALTSCWGLPITVSDNATATACVSNVSFVPLDADDDFPAGNFASKSIF